VAQEHNLVILRITLDINNKKRIKLRAVSAIAELLVYDVQDMRMKSTQSWKELRICWCIRKNAWIHRFTTKTTDESCHWFCQLLKGIVCARMPPPVTKNQVIIEWRISFLCWRLYQHSICRCHAVCLCVWLSVCVIVDTLCLNNTSTTLLLKISVKTQQILIIFDTQNPE